MHTKPYYAFIRWMLNGIFCNILQLNNFLVAAAVAAASSNAVVTPLWQC